MKKLLVLGTVLGVMAIGIVAYAQSLDGGCTVQANSGIDSTTMVDATQQDPFRIDPGGTLSWVGSSAGAIKNHTWEIGIYLGGFFVAVASGGDPNDAGTQTSEGTRSIPELVEQAAASGVPMADQLSSLRGIYRVGGQIAGEGGSCSGDGYVLIEGSPLSEPLGLGAAIVAAVGLIMTILAGIKKAMG
jgi:hypothetical protein